MSENKTSKYFKYAIGEIVLVVIGILIALKINNWNEDNKNRDQEKILLTSILTDLDADIKRINQELKAKKMIYNDYIICLDILANRKTATKEEFFNHFKSILEVGALNLNTTAFDNMKASSQLSLIKNNKLSDEIVQYYNTNYNNFYTALSDYTRNITAPYLLNFDYIPYSYVSDILKKRGIPRGKINFDWQEDTSRIC